MYSGCVVVRQKSGPLASDEGLDFPPTVQAALSQRLGTIAARTPSLVLNRKTEGRDKDKRRVLEIYLKNGVPGVPGVPS